MERKAQSRSRGSIGVRKVAVYSTCRPTEALSILRIYGPLSQAGIEVLGGLAGDGLDLDIIRAADLVLVQRDFPGQLQAYRRVVAQARAEAKPIFYDVDDVLLELPVEHPDRHSHYYTRALVPMVGAALEADAVLTSTSALQEYYGSLNSNAWVYPNLLNDEIWAREVPEPIPAHAPLVIGYFGTITHAPDLEEVSPALEELLARHGSALALRFWGCRPPAALQGDPRVTWTALAAPRYDEYAAIVREAGVDIGIAPLVDTTFNQAKSPIKYFEYSAAGIPAVYSSVAPYRAVVEDGRTGFLAKTKQEWVEHLGTLIESPDARDQMRRNAHEQVLTRWALSRNTALWPEVVEQALRMRKKPDGTAPRLRGAMNSIALQLDELERDRVAQQELRQAEADATLRRAVALREEEAAGLRSGLDSRDKEIVRLQSELASQVEEAALVRSQVTLGQKEIAHLQSELASQVEEAALVRSQVTLGEKEIAHLQSELASQVQEAALVRSQVASGEKEIAHLQSELASQAREVALLGSQRVSGEQEIADLRSSTSWKVTAPLRALSSAWMRVTRSGPRRGIGSSWRSGRHLMVPVPGRHLKVEADGRFRSTGEDPHFILQSSRGRLPEGWAEIGLEIHYQEMDESAPRVGLYPDTGQGYAEETAIYLPKPDSGRIRHIVQLPEGMVNLRLDPCDSPGVFTLRHVRIREMGTLQVAWRALWPKVRPALSNPRLLFLRLGQGLHILRDGSLEAVVRRNLEEPVAPRRPSRPH